MIIRQVFNKTKQMAQPQKKISNRRFWFWISAAAFTLLTVIYQRLTGPTNPYRGIYVIENATHHYKLGRSPECGFPYEIIFPGSDVDQAELFWREYPTERPWKSVPMKKYDANFQASIPSQPPAGKVEYYIQLKTKHSEIIQIPNEKNRIIARFKNPVPVWALLPHIVLMFTGMLLSNKLGISVFLKEPLQNNLVWITFLCLFFGIGIFGPIVQKFAFGQYWTGWPIGTDLTDNKSLAVLLIWIFPVWRVWRKRDVRTSLKIASISTLIIFLIPHSLLGSEYDYSRSNITNESFLPNN